DHERYDKIERRPLGDRRVQAGGHGEGPLPGHRGQPGAGTELRGPLSAAQGRGHRRDVHRAQELVRGSGGENLPPPLAEDRGHRRNLQGRRPEGEALLHPGEGRQEGPGQEGHL
ncbi:MAG: LSU ribosomal protein L19p, partial [uncultured Rubrobacteraceae bacterium]